MKLENNKKIDIIFTILILILLVLPTFFTNNVISENIKIRVTPRDNKVNINQINYTQNDKIISIINDINESSIRANLEILTSEYSGRITGSDICEQAGDWIYNEFKKAANLKVEKLPWTERANIFYHFKEYSCSNIEAELTGTSGKDDIYIFCAHYDTDKVDSPGALDNGASVAAMITIAQAMSKHEFNNTVKFIAFSGEELSFLGSNAYARSAYFNGDNIIGVLNADVIGNNSYNTNHPKLLRAYSSYSARWIVDIMNNTSDDFEIGINVEPRLYYGHSDDKSFDDYGYSVMQLYQASNSMEHFFGNENDTLDLINFSYLTDMAKCIASCLAVLADYKIDAEIIIESPLEDKVYARSGNILLNLSKGKTVVFGNIIIGATVLHNNVSEVIFELIGGYNEYVDSSQERPILATFIDDTPPYVWNFDERIFGQNTIRVTANTSGEKYFCDEIEIFFVNL